MSGYFKLAIGFLFFSITIFVLGVIRQALPYISPITIAPQEVQTEIQNTHTEEIATSTEELIKNETIEERQASSTLSRYIEVVDSCGPYFENECLNARLGPGTEYPARMKLRNGMVLKVGETIENESGTWYKIVFDEWLRYPERATQSLYVSAQYVHVFEHIGVEELAVGEKASTTKRIIVDRSDQMLYAYDGDELFMQEKISTGLELTPTPRGVFTVFKKMPSRYMQGPIPGISTKEYDLPGVPWNLYFTTDGAVVHGAYWHDNFGKSWSNGCVNLPPKKAQELYDWAELGMTVTVRD